MVEESIKMRSYVERIVIYSDWSVLSEVSFENGGYIIMGRVYSEVRNDISSAFRLLSKAAVFGEDHAAVLVFPTSLSKRNFASRSDNITRECSK